MGSSPLKSDNIASELLRVKLLADKIVKIDRHKVYGRLLEEHFEEVLAALKSNHQSAKWQALENLVEAGKATVVFTDRISVIPEHEDAAEVQHPGLECGTIGEIVDELELATSAA